MANYLHLMRRVLLVVSLLLAVTLQSCRCADPPPMDPIEGQDQENAG